MSYESQRPLLEEATLSALEARASVIAAFLPLEALDPHVIASASRSDDASGRSMLITVTRSFGYESHTVAPVFLDDGVQPEPEYPADRAVRW